MSVWIVDASLRLVLLHILGLLELDKELFVGTFLAEILNLYLWPGLGKLGEPVRPVEVVEPVLDVDLHRRRLLCRIQCFVVQEEVELAYALQSI